MCKNSQKAFAILAWLAGSPQGGAEQPLVSGNSAFNLPAIVVNALMEPLLHLSAVFGRRPPAATSPDVKGNDCGADAELFSTQAMVVFPVVGGVSKKPIKAQVLCRLDDSLRELSRVVRWSTGHYHPGNQMGLAVTDDGHLWPATAAETLVALALNVIGAGVAVFQSGGVDRPFGTLVYLAEGAGSLESRSEQALKSPFFSRRFSA